MAQISEIETVAFQAQCSLLVEREVKYCISGLVAMLAQGYGRSQDMDRTPGYDLPDLIEQAFELTVPVEDWEEAARQAGWEPDPMISGGWRKQIAPDDFDCAVGAEDACRGSRVEAYEWEVYEHWIVSDWLAAKLEEAGERIDRDFAGLTVWGRTTTGQAISMDAVIERIVRAMNTPAS